MTVRMFRRAAALAALASLAAMPRCAAAEDVLPPGGGKAWADGFLAGWAIGRGGGGEPAFRRLAADSTDWALLSGIAAALSGRGAADLRLAADGLAGIPADPSVRPPPAVLDTHLSPPVSLPAPFAEETGKDTDPLAAAGLETFWIRLGLEDSPGLYMWADPACPHCADALNRLSGDISAGRLHVRIALAPVLGAESAALAATLMLENDPAEAAWQALLGAARGGPTEPVPGAVAAIGELGVALLQANIDWMRARGVTAVPHFVWLEQSGWREAAGAQPAERFLAALPLPPPGGAMHAPPELLAAGSPAEGLSDEDSIPPLPAD